MSEKPTLPDRWPRSHGDQTPCGCGGTLTLCIGKTGADWRCDRCVLPWFPMSEPSEGKTP
jgi:hypothetical protein